MIHALALLMAIYAVGEVVAQTLGLPVPGAVLGMLLLFLLLILRGEIPQPLQQTANTLVSNIGLFIVPAGVGLLVEARGVGAELLAVAVTIAASTLIGALATGYVMQALRRRRLARARPDVAAAGDGEV